MIPWLTMIVAMYVLVRFLELASNENARGESGRTWLILLCCAGVLVTLGSCTAVQLSGTTVPTP
jgi:hypothetical protein